MTASSSSPPSLPWKNAWPPPRRGPKPFFISDSGDNPGAGGADDVTVALAALLAWKPVQEATLDVVYASIIAPVAAAIAWEAGVGAEVDLGAVDTSTLASLDR